MTRVHRRGNLLRRIEELESRSMDASGLAPHSLAWLEFWQRELDKFATGQEYTRLPLEAARAIIQASPDEGDEGDSQSPRAA